MRGNGPSGRRFAFVAGLRPDGPSSLPHPASSPQTAQKAAQAVGPGAVAWAVETGALLAEKIVAEVPGHRSDDGREIMRAGTEAAALSLLLALAGGSPDTATSDSLDGVEDFVRRGLTVEEMLRGIRIGHTELVARLLPHCPPEEVQELMEACFAFFGSFSDTMGEEFRRQEARWSATDSADRLRVVEDLLSGRLQRLAPASASLRYDLGRVHVGLVAWSEDRTMPEADRAVARALTRLLQPLAAEGHVDQRLVLPAGVGVAWAWVSPAPGSDRLADRLEPPSLPAGVRVALGARRQGLSGFRETHDDALAVFGLLAARENAPSIVPYRRVDAVSLLLSDRPRALRFARDELGGLAAEAPGVADLRRTVAVYLELGGSPRAAAERLMVSRNTVTYRVHRAEELLGRPLTERPLQLQAALAIMEGAGL